MGVKFPLFKSKIMRKKYRLIIMDSLRWEKHTVEYHPLYKSKEDQLSRIKEINETLTYIYMYKK